MRHLIALAASALLLAACGGGGSGSSGSSDFAVEGVAAKGRISAGVAEAVSISSTGVESTVLGSATFANFEPYKLRFAGAPGQPYVIRVRAAAGATHQDELNGLQTLPANFTLRAAVVPPAFGSIKINVTPFTEMAVSAATRSGGGLTSANVQKANATVATLLGLDAGQNLPSVTPPTTSTAAVTPDEQRMIVMLTAVSKLSNDGALGCAASDVGCVVSTLATAATTTVTLGTATTPLRNAVDAVKVLLDDVIPPSLVVTDNLQCTSNCSSVTPVDSTVADAIAATKTLISELRSDIVTLFGDPAVANSTGDAITQGDQFSAAMRAVQAPADMLVRDSGLLHLGLQLYADVKGNRSTDMVRFMDPDVFGTDSTSGPQARCRLYTDANIQTQATSASNANFIGCAMPYYYEAANNVEYIHGFVVTPASGAGGTGGSFTYSATARARNFSTLATVSRPGLPLPAGPTAGTATPATGTITATFTSGGLLTAWAATGSVPGNFKAGSTTPASDHASWNISGNRTFSATATSSSTISGTVTSFNAAGTTLGTLVVKSGTLTTVPNPFNANDGVVNSASLDVVYTRPAGTAPGAEFEGSISAGSFQFDASNTNRNPTQITLGGRLATVTSSGTNNFLQGTLTLSLTGFSSFNDTQPTTSTNSYTINANFSGSVTAPGRPELQATVATSMKNFDLDPSSATVQYRSMNGTTTRMAINVTASRDTGGNYTLQVAETTRGISTTITQTGKHDVLLGSTKIGEYDAATGTFTFTDGSGVSGI